MTCMSSQMVQLAMASYLLFILWHTITEMSKIREFEISSSSLHEIEHINWLEWWIVNEVHCQATPFVVQMFSTFTLIFLLFFKTNGRPLCAIWKCFTSAIKTIGIIFQFQTFCVFTYVFHFNAFAAHVHSMLHLWRVSCKAAIEK